ncbi:MAG: phosphoethanolamine transferase [Paraprevotella sp.]|nr:phosphoethanolamine transferase [Paraprevotella sp.]
MAFVLQSGQPVADYPLGSLFVEVFVLAWVFSFLPGGMRRAVQGMVCTVCAVVCAVDVYVTYRLGSGLTPTMLQLVLETDAEEMSDFCNSYLRDAAVLRAFGPFLLWGTIYIAYVRSRHALSVSWMKFCRLSAPWRVVLRVVYTLTVWGVFVVLFCRTAEDRRHTRELLSQTTTAGMERYYNKGYGRGLYSPLHRLYFAVYANRLAAGQLEHLRTRMGTTNVECGEDGIPTLVVIIGESYNRHHSALYGYSLPTTPRQCARVRNGELFPFTDVVSCWNLTSNVFKYMFSLYGYGHKGTWCDEPLFPALFRKAGYRVAFLTNQFVRRPDDNAFDFSGGYFINDSRLSNSLFDVRNERKHPFDEDLLLDYDSLCADSLYSRRLVMFHLIGQHVGYENRCPDERKRFMLADYERPDLTDDQLQKVVDYDNATLYNDSVVDAVLRRFEADDALVLYVPDHGEEVYDGLKTFGRLHSSALTPRMVHNEFEIPFWIWCSPVCRRNRPELVHQIMEAVDRPFMTDDLPHTLLYLADIRCPEYDERRAVISPQFDMGRRRLLKGYKDYDEMRAREKAGREEKKNSRECGGRSRR